MGCGCVYPVTRIYIYIYIYIYGGAVCIKLRWSIGLVAGMFAGDVVYIYMCVCVCVCVPLIVLDYDGKNI